jgi:hypothetical protein
MRIFVFVFALFAVMPTHAETNTEDAIPEPVIELTELMGTITLKNGVSPEVALVLTVTNPSDTPYTGQIGFAGAEIESLSINAGEEQDVSLSVTSRHAGKADALQKAEIDLSLILDDQPAPAIGNVDIDIQVPVAAYPLVRSEPPVMQKSAEAEAQYEFYALSQQLQPLKFTYNPGPHNLEVRKTVYPIPIEPGPIEISIEVTNHGTEATTALVLRDTLDDADFAGSGSAFRRFVADEATDLVWEAELPSIAPGESRLISYTVSARYAVGDKQLPATTVIMNDELTGLSNKVWLPKWH